MKIFWSWQADTPGKIGRHFVRAALEEAVEALKRARDIEEPAERDAREAIHVDQDRQGVTGSPALAQTIFTKIEQAEVFVADVTTVGTSIAIDSETLTTKRLINSNVAIEYGFAEHAIGDRKILLVQNTHYGQRNDLPFDLRHKAGPLQYHLPPNASSAEIKAALAHLRGRLVEALRPFLTSRNGPDRAAPRFAETPSIPGSPMQFADGSFPLASVGVAGSDEIVYYWREARAFHLRLIPTKSLARHLKFSDLQQIISRNRLFTLSRNAFSSCIARNSLGAIVYEPQGSSPQPLSMTQIFRNGEIWSIGSGFHQGRNRDIIPAMNIQNIVTRTLSNFCDVAANEFGLEPPFTIEIGGHCLGGSMLCISPTENVGPIHQNELVIRRVLNNLHSSSAKELVDEYMESLFELAGFDWPR
ncbi:hypothetical protein ACVILK_004322 [Bradyrhizobium embrapense]